MVRHRKPHLDPIFLDTLRPDGEDTPRPKGRCRGTRCLDDICLDTLRPEEICLDILHL